MAEPATPPLRKRIVTCPACRGESIYDASNAYRPFCSARCKNMDFGAWADESFRVAADPDPLEPAPGTIRLQ